MLNLILVIHNHQPLGNLDGVFRKAYDTAYKPFLDVVRKHPGIKWALHSSACLWEWMEANEPVYLENLREEQEAGRLEFFSGGMWEPIQPLIGEAAFFHQFSCMREFLRSRFGVEPEGSWTTERVWEPSLAGRLSRAGIRYTLLDDSQLRAGLPSPEEHRVWGYYRTEFDGQSVAIFPINEKLRYMIPFKPADQTMALLERWSTELPEGAGITYGDDGEKFGLWPNTYDWVFKKGWLDEFFGRLENSDQVRTVHPSEYIRMNPHPRQRVYIPTSSYREMGIWTLFPRRNLAADGIYKWVESNEALKRVEPPHVSGLFRTFLARYPESRYMHERVEELLRIILEKEPDAEPSIDVKASPASRAIWHLLRAQCNCTYWHGVFGGLYLNYLRFAVHRSILHAEKELQTWKHKLPSIRHIGTRHYPGGSTEASFDDECPLLYGTKNVQWVIDPKTGQVISAGSVEKAVDVTDVLARRFEAYHATMREASADEDLSGGPASIHDIREVAPHGWGEGHGYDRVRKGCFGVHILDWSPGIGQFARMDFNSVAGPESGHWHAEAGDKKINLSSNLPGWSREKKFSFSRDGRTAGMEYILSRRTPGEFEGWAFIEFNLGLLAGDAPDRYHELPDGDRCRLGERIEVNGRNEAKLVDEWTGVRITLKAPDADWYGAYPVNTLSRGEAGLELNYQGTCVIFRIPVITSAGTKWQTGAQMSVQPL